MLRKCYQAEVLKNKGTAAEKLLFLMPILTAILVAGLMRNYFAVGSYNWWYTALYPATVSMICALAGEREKRQKNRTVLSLPVDLKAIWDGKVLYGVRMMSLSMLVMAGISLSGSFLLEKLFHVTFQMEVSWERQLLAVAVLIVTFMWQVPFCLLLHQLTGISGTFLIHMASYILFACSLSLKPYYAILPGAIPARMMCVVLEILPNGLAAEPGQVTFVPEVLDASLLVPGFFSAIIWFLIFWAAGRKYYERRLKNQ